MERYLYFNLDLCCQGHSSNLFDGPLFSQTHGEGLKKMGGIVRQILDIFTFFSIFTLKANAKFCNNLQFFVEFEYVSHKMQIVLILNDLISITLFIFHSTWPITTKFVQKLGITFQITLK